MCPGVVCGPCGHRGGHHLHHSRPAIRWHLQTPRAFMSHTLERKVRVCICGSQSYHTGGHKGRGDMKTWLELCCSLWNPSVSCLLLQACVPLHGRSGVLGDLAQCVFWTNLWCSFSSSSDPQLAFPLALRLSLSQLTHPWNSSLI